MELTSWRDRLKRETKLRVYGALTENLARRVAQRTGDAAFLSWLSEVGGESEVIGLVRQFVATEVSVLLRVSSLHGPEQGLVELARVRRAVRSALVGWQPTYTDGGEELHAEEVEFRRGQAIAVDPKGVQWWQDVYATRYLITEEA
ncbi:MAG: hypothetical protein F4X59_17345 [Holophagales bacterium]|nr:hypothetical protein [Holophagales bacterium]MYC11872.1 hypothetical protein [Holophagales bacterium]